MQETRFLDHGKWISICVFSFLMDKSRMLTVFSALGIEVFFFLDTVLKNQHVNYNFFFDSVQISLKQNNALARTIASYGVSFVFTGNCAVQSEHCIESQIWPNSQVRCQTGYLNPVWASWRARITSQKRLWAKWTSQSSITNNNKQILNITVWLCSSSSWTLSIKYSRGLLGFFRWRISAI